MDILFLQGLAAEELHIYKTLLKLKQATVLELSKTTAINRTTLYRVLDSLIEKGLVAKIHIKRKHYFMAERPKRLLEFSRAQEAKVRDLLPELLAIDEEASERPKIKFFEGKEGIRVLFDHLLEGREEILSFTYPDNTFGSVPFMQDFVSRRIKLKVPTRLIAQDSAFARSRKARGPEDLRQVKLVKHLPLEAAYFIAGNKVVMFSLKSWHVGVLIENRQIAQGLRMIFEAFWQSIK